MIFKDSFQIQKSLILNAYVMEINSNIIMLVIKWNQTVVEFPKISFEISVYLYNIPLITNLFLSLYI